jgi:hypothetical protein
VKVAKRDNCWVERKENFFRQVHEEVGPCSRPPPKWSDDRLTRLVQECVADADYRWSARAVEAWRKRRPEPAQPDHDEVLRACMDEARGAVAAESELSTLRARLAELSTERDALLADLARDRTKLQESHAQLAEWLGKAAQKPPGNAVATSSSTATGNGNGSGLAGSDGTTTVAKETASAPAAPVTQGRYSRKPTPSRTSAVPSSSRTSTGCSRQISPAANCANSPP